MCSWCTVSWNLTVAHHSCNMGLVLDLSSALLVRHPGFQPSVLVTCACCMCREAASAPSARFAQNSAVQSFLLSWLPELGRQLRSKLTYSQEMGAEERMDLFSTCAFAGCVRCPALDKSLSELRTCVICAQHIKIIAATLPTDLRCNTLWAPQNMRQDSILSVRRSTTTCRAPETFERGVAAYGLLTCTAQLSKAYSTAAVPLVLPSALSALADPAPFVQACGACALRHMADHATAASLHSQRDLLMHAVQRCLTGCDEAAWPVVLPCAFALAQRLDSVDGGCGRLLQMLDAAIAEAARGGHQASVRDPFLRALCSSCSAPDAMSRRSVVQHAGLQLVGRFRQLLPMLLEWVALVDAAGLESVCEVPPLPLVHGKSDQHRGQTCVCLLHQGLCSSWCFTAVLCIDTTASTTSCSHTGMMAALLYARNVASIGHTAIMLTNARLPNRYLVFAGAFAGLGCHNPAHAQALSHHQRCARERMHTLGCVATRRCGAI